MKRFAIAAAAIMLSGTAAMAQTYVVPEDETYMGERGVSGPVYDSPSEATNYQFQPGGTSTAPGFSAQNETEAMERTPNVGAGTSKSSNANQG